MNSLETLAKNNYILYARIYYCYILFNLLLGLQGPWRRQMCRDMDCLCCKELWPYQSLFSSLLYLVIRKPLWPVFLHSSARSGARGLPCLGSFSVVWRIRHIEGSPFAGVLLCRSEHQSLKGAPWVGSYSEVPWVRHLMGQPLFFSCRCWRVGKERLW